MAVKVFDSELKVMEALWKEGDLTAGQLAKMLKEQVGWNRNTTYTVIGKLIDKGAVERYGSNFSCKAIITKEQVQQHEAKELVGKLFDGSAEVFLSAFLSDNALSDNEITRLKQLVDKYDGLKEG
ncbi:MAG: BlaI/MecI/CopY family transcriptional regulator [Defluviitaleaceae bacterium]|nr:BlaI/MecI/CopY family transcriptional regulator [Defluviitaleaceae bacterium]